MVAIFLLNSESLGASSFNLLYASASKRPFMELKTVDFLYLFLNKHHLPLNGRYGHGGRLYHTLLSIHPLFAQASYCLS